MQLWQAPIQRVGHKHTKPQATSIPNPCSPLCLGVEAFENIACIHYVINVRTFVSSCPELPTSVEFANEVRVAMLFFPPLLIFVAVGGGPGWPQH